MRLDFLRPCLGLALVVFFATGSAGRGDDTTAVEDGYLSLFNGKDLTGWKLPGETLDGKTESANHRFSARDGAIVCTGDKGTPPVISTVREFPRDFTLRLEFRANSKANSGLFLRGKQLQVRDYPTVGPYKDLKKYKDGDWNAIEVIVTGDTARCTCNGELLEAALDVKGSGGIGLQAETNQLEYRRLRIKQSP